MHRQAVSTTGRAFISKSQQWAVHSPPGASANLHINEYMHIHISICEWIHSCVVSLGCIQQSGHYQQDPTPKGDPAPLRLEPKWPSGLRFDQKWLCVLTYAFVPPRLEPKWPSGLRVDPKRLCVYTYLFVFPSLSQSGQAACALIRNGYVFVLI